MCCCRSSKFRSNVLQQTSYARRVKKQPRCNVRFIEFFIRTGEINFEPSMKDTAYKIGLTHETFCRELNYLERESVIVRKGRKFTLSNLPV